MGSFAAVVSVHGVRVGQLDRLGDDEDHVFTFDGAWLDDPDRPTLGVLFEDRRPDPIETSGVPCWFAHLLPQGPWARHLRRWAGLVGGEPDLELLLAIGGDLPGAISMDRAVPRLFEPGRYASSRRESSGLRFSLAGAQWKLSVRPGERGLVVPVAGGQGRYIAKFEDPAFPGLPRVEWCTMQWAARSGIDVPQSRLASAAEFDQLPPDLPVGSGTVHVVERFDREGDQRVHFEDMGQITDRTPGDPGQYTGSYEQIGAVVRTLCAQDVDQFLDRLVFMLLSGNADAHLKNWAITYEHRRIPRLSPAYDLVCTVVYPQLGRALALEFAGARSFGGVNSRAWGGMARAVDRTEREILAIVRTSRDRAETAWQATRDLPFSNAERAAITAHMSTIPKWSP